MDGLSTRVLNAIRLWSGMLQLYCVFIFTAASSIVGAIVSEVMDVVASVTRSSKFLEERLESYRSIKPRFELPRISMKFLLDGGDFLWPKH